MATNLTSFRFPFALPDDVHPAVRDALRLLFQGNTDLNQAIAALVPKVNAHGSSISTINQTISETNVSGGGGSSAPLAGTVNQQTGTSYTIQISDFGALVILQSPSTFALTLNIGVGYPFYCVVENSSVGLATLTPSTGTINNVASVNLVVGQFALVFFDGVNWWSTVIAQTFVQQPHQWLNSYDANAGVFAASQPHAYDLADSTTGAGYVVLDSGCGLVNPTFTGITKIVPLQVFANNAAAISGGLVAGDLYRNGANPDGVFIVH